KNEFPYLEFKKPKRSFDVLQKGNNFTLEEINTSEWDERLDNQSVNKEIELRKKDELKIINEEGKNERLLDVKKQEWNIEQMDDSQKIKERENLRREEEIMRRKEEERLKLLEYERMKIEEERKRREE